jgi:hypothetical protein
MKKDPAFLFYSADFLVGTMHFTDAQVGKYIRLLCFQHQHGIIPEQHFNALCNGDEILRSKFRLDSHGNLYNERLKEEASKRIKFVMSRRRNLLGKHHMGNHMEDHTTVRMENENEDVNVIVNTTTDKTILNNILSVFIKHKGYERGKLQHQDYARMYCAIKKLLKLAGDEVEVIKECIDWVAGKDYIDWTLETCVKKWHDFIKQRPTEAELRFKKSLEESNAKKYSR